MNKRLLGFALACTLALGIGGVAYASEEAQNPDEAVEGIENVEAPESAEASASAGSAASVEAIEAVDVAQEPVVESDEIDEPDLEAELEVDTEVDDGAEAEEIETTPAAGDPSLTFSKSSPCAFAAGITINLTINDSATGRMYKIVWQRNGSWDDGDWGVLREPGTEKTGIEWKPNKPGTYTFYLDWSEDSFKTSETTTCDYSLTENYSYKKAVSSPAQSALVGQPIALSADVSGNTANLKYKFVWVYNGSWATGNWGVVQAMGPTNSATYTPTKQGTYTFYVDVQDSTGNISTQAVSVRVGKLGLECVQGSKVAYAKGMSLNLNALKSPGLYEKFKFVWSYNGSWADGNWGVIQDMSTADTAVWKPKKAGNYVLYLDAMDSTGAVTSVSTEIVLTEDWKFKAIECTPPSPQTISTADETVIKVNTTGNNGALQYKFVWQKNGSWASGNWGVLQAKSSNNTATFNWNNDPNKFGVGTYTIYVDIFDSQGKVTTKTIKYVVAKRWTWNGFSLTASEQKVNKPVTITAKTGADNTGLQYKFVWQKNGSWASGNWGVLQDWSSSNSVTMKPDTPGDFTIYVDIKDKDGSIDHYNTRESGQIYYAYQLQGLSCNFEAATGGIELAVVLSPDWGASHFPSGFKYTYRWSTGSNSGTIATNTTKTKVAWVPDQNVFNYTFYVDATSPDNVTTTYKKNVTLPTGGDYRWSGGTYWSIVIDRNQHWLVLYENYGNKIRYIWRCTNGAPSTPTPTGWYSIESKLYYFDAEYGIRCFYASGFIGSVYLIHSTLYNQPATYPSEDAVRDPTLGEALSHGCVRIAVENAHWVYNNIPYGTSVRIYDWYG